MEKKLMILLMVVSLVLVGCGCSKKEKVVEPKEEEEEIVLKLGNKEQTYTAKSITCGEHEIQSKVVFSDEKDEDGKYKGSYELYECNEDNVNLKTAEGTYSVDGAEAIFVDSYGEQLVFEATSDDTLALKEGSKKVETFTK